MKTANRKSKSKTRTENWQGMNWITQVKRLQIYLRDGCACCYCGATVENGVSLSLDHLTPHSRGHWLGKKINAETNLVTSCLRCNQVRGNRTVEEFATVVASYINHGVTAEQIVSHVVRCSERPIAPLKAEALALIARRGSASKALENSQN